MIYTLGYYDFNYGTKHFTNNAYRVDPVTKVKGIYPVNKKGNSYLYKIAQANYQTCNKKKYVDQSNDDNVSFKTPTDISPNRSCASPERVHSYSSGGDTSTQLQYNKKNPYDSARKTVAESYLKGLYIDYIA